MSECSEGYRAFLSWADEMPKSQQLPYLGGREPSLDALGGFQVPVAHLQLAPSCRYGFGVWRSINYHHPIPQQLYTNSYNAQTSASHASL